MAKKLLMVMLSNKGTNGEGGENFRFHYRSYGVLSDTGKAIEIKVSKGNPYFNDSAVCKSELGKVYMTDMYNLKMHIISYTETDDVKALKAEVRELYKVLRSAALKELKQMNQQLKKLYIELDNMVV